MSEIHYIERVPRRADFCGCPPCWICYEPVITDDQQAPTFQQTMLEIYGKGPKPQTEQEYEWAHAAAHQCRLELEAAARRGGEFFEAEDRARMTQMQIDDLLKRAKRAAEAPKPLNTVNLDNMPARVKEAEEKERKVRVGELYQYQSQAALNGWTQSTVADQRNLQQQNSPTSNYGMMIGSPGDDRKGWF